MVGVTGQRMRVAGVCLVRPEAGVYDDPSPRRVRANGL